MSAVILCLIILIISRIFTVFSSTKDTGSHSSHSGSHSSTHFGWWQQSSDNNKAELRGQIGENDVKRILSYLPKEEYIVLNDVLLPSNNRMTQLDHVVVSLYGIFVIETKNYSGTIYGSPNSQQWTQYSHGQKYSFHNPLFQNQVHVDAILKKTHVYSRDIIPLVVFTGSACIKAGQCRSVINIEQLYETIKRYQNKIFTPEQIDYYARIIDFAIEESDENKRKHIQSVQDRIIRREIEISHGFCPQCNGRLVLRQSKYGQFYGCSNYPKCKYTKNINS